MNDRGGDVPPPANGGEFLLQLLRKPPVSHPPTNRAGQSPPQTSSYDPAVAAVGPTIPTFSPYRPSNHSPSPPFAPHNYFPQNPNANPNLNPDFPSLPGGFNYSSNQFNLQSNGISLGHDTKKLGFFAENPKPSGANQQEQNLIFGSLNDAGNVLHESLGQSSKLGISYLGNNLQMDTRLNGFQMNSIAIDGNACGNSSISRGYEQESNCNSDIRGKQGRNGNYSVVAPPPGFSNKIKNVGNRDYGNGRTWNHNVDKGKDGFGDLDKNNSRSNKQLDSPGPPAGSSLHSVSAFEESMLERRGEDGDNGEELRYVRKETVSRDEVPKELDDLEDQLVGSLRFEGEPDEKKSDEKKHHRDKEYRSDNRGQWIMGQRMRNRKRQTSCRRDINRLNAPFLAVFETLIPPDEEKVKQKQLFTVLKKLVSKEWPEAQLYLYGSCDNSFGFSKSDIDVCLAMEDGNIDKCEVLLKLADILQADNLQNVQALTRARVPIVKLMDPVTGISCDICVNNVLAVENTKLLRDYAQIDVRLRQLVFIVKHWAKSRRVNETYRGTLSSYAYVMMSIHFLQQRTPAILPCLQRMETTYFANVDNVECSYFDQVEKLHNFGVQNGESIAQLVWAFFHYWAYCHDYANDVISVRMGGTISKSSKDWTTRVGNDRHLICIEDPFEVSHDLGRVVDKYSIRVLREEFERAAKIMQYDPNPFVTLFEPYIPN